MDEIVQVIEEDRKLIAVDIERDTYLNSPSASLSTIKNRWAERGLRASFSIPQYIPAEALSEYLEFARVYVKTPDIWDKFVFSDESDLFPYKSGKLYIRRYSGEYPRDIYNISTRWDPRTVKIWG